MPGIRGSGNVGMERDGDVPIAPLGVQGDLISAGEGCCHCLIGLIGDAGAVRLGIPTGEKLVVGRREQITLPDRIVLIVENRIVLGGHSRSIVGIVNHLIGMLGVGNHDVIFAVGARYGAVACGDVIRVGRVWNEGAALDELRYAGYINFAGERAALDVQLRVAAGHLQGRLLACDGAAFLYIQCAIGEGDAFCFAGDHRAIFHIHRV